MLLGEISLAAPFEPGDGGRHGASRDGRGDSRGRTAAFFLVEVTSDLEQPTSDGLEPRDIGMAK